MDTDMDDALIVKSKRGALKDREEPPKKKAKSEIIPEVRKHKSPQVEPRRYQINVLERAMKENTILYLETGSGKTFIAALLIKQIADRLLMPHEKHIAVFLAPTVHLVMQQGNVLSVNTHVRVGVYYGDKGIDTWSITKWQEELDLHEVLVMTPQLFLDALSTSAIKMEIVELLIIDECHHAQKNHPYALIMKTQYHTPSLKLKPKIFGMTASPIIKKGLSSISECARQIQELESILDAKVYTLEDRTELESLVPTPHQGAKFYSKSICKFDNVRARLAGLRDQYMKENTSTNEADQQKLEEVSKLINALHNAIDYCLSELGLLAARMALDIYLKSDKQMVYSDMDEPEDVLKKNHKIKFLREASTILSDAIPQGPAPSYDRAEDFQVAARNGVITSKIRLLVKVLLRYRDVENMRCIVFVERVIASMVLAKLIQQFKCMNFVRADYMAGVNAELCSKTPNQQQKTVISFREGQLNLLIATSVAEEGLDVQKCSSVIRFDLCHTLRSYIQSRGRARNPRSDYVWLLESGNVMEEELLLEMIESEKSMKEHALSRVDMDIDRGPPLDGDLEFFRIASGACLSSENSISFLHRYCAKLPGDRYYNPKPEFSYKEIEQGSELYVCTIKLPPNAPIHYLEGPGRRTKQLSKKAACLEACKQLHSIGALASDTLCPVAETDEEEVMNMVSKDITGSGTTKLKELYPSIRPAVLHGTWLNNSKEEQFHVYELSFQVEPPESQTYANFAFLVQAALDDDVACSEVPLYKSNSKVLARLSVAGQIWLNMNQLTAAKVYHEIIFNGAFSRLQFRQQDDKTIVNCLLTCEERRKDLWIDSQMYLLLPLTNSTTSTSAHPVDINWESIYVTAEASRRFQVLSCVSEEENRREMEEDVGLDVLHTAGGPLHGSIFRDCVVLTIHTGKIYCIADILHSLNATCKFPEKGGTEPCTYAEFFERKYGKLLKFPSQPLLKAKQTHSLHNLLSRHQTTEKLGKKAMIKCDIVGRFVELPPELCLVIGQKSEVIRSLYLVPSFMHRLISLIDASQLRANIKQLAPCCPSIPASEILKGLTSKRCQEGFSYEGLELLGDSFLKYAVTKKLFLVYTEKHEGQLSARRSRAICNATLRRLAILRGVPAYIRDEVFDPSRWIAPGMYRLRRTVCKCDMTKLVTEDNSSPKPTEVTYKIGKTCAEGHRWLCSKTTADVVEALIGVYLVHGGDQGAVEFMKFMNIDVDFDPSLANVAQEHSQVPPESLEHMMSTLKPLEKQLSYTFRNRALLLEAITHASHHDSCYCYQRLEFLGDAALDLLISKHLFREHPGLSPGLLTDLRSAAVNNECFARVAVKYNFQRYLRHGSGQLHGQITAFVKAVHEDSDTQALFGFEGLTGPKVLGDLVESIAGAILVDSHFDLEVVWKVMQPFLSPIVTPATLPLHPIRELQELCSSKIVNSKWRELKSDAKNMTTIEITVTIGKQKFVEKSQKKQKKAAKKDAAQKMLRTLKEQGFKYPRMEVVKHCQMSDLASVEADATESLRPELARVEADAPEVFTNEPATVEAHGAEVLTSEPARIGDGAAEVSTSESAGIGGDAAEVIRSDPARVEADASDPAKIGGDAAMSDPARVEADAAGTSERGVEADAAEFLISDPASVEADAAETSERGVEAYAAVVMTTETIAEEGEILTSETIAEEGEILTSETIAEEGEILTSEPLRLEVDAGQGRSLGNGTAEVSTSNMLEIEPKPGVCTDLPCPVFELLEHDYEYLWHMTEAVGILDVMDVDIGYCERLLPFLDSTPVGNQGPQQDFQMYTNAIRRIDELTPMLAMSPDGEASELVGNQGPEEDVHMYANVISEPSTPEKTISEDLSSAKATQSTSSPDQDLLRDIKPLPVPVVVPPIGMKLAVPSDPPDSRIERPGGARSFLYEACNKRKWPPPKFEEREEIGKPHKRQYIYSLSLTVPGRDRYEEVGSAMPDKKKAMDDAAKKLVYKLRGLGIFG